MTTSFIGVKQGRNIYSFECDNCGVIGEVGVPPHSQEIFSHCDNGVVYIQRFPKSLFEKPRLEEIVVTKEGKA